MSFYRSMIAAVAAFSLATVVFAADENAMKATPSTEAAQPALQVADASSSATPAPAASVSFGSVPKIEAVAAPAPVASMAFGSVPKIDAGASACVPPAVMPEGTNVDGVGEWLK